MYIYAIVNKSKNINITYFSTIVEACIEFNKHYCFDTHCIKRYSIEYENDVEMKVAYDVMVDIGVINATAYKKISLNDVQDEVDKGYTTTMLRGKYATTTCREKNTHTNPKFRMTGSYQIHKHNAEQ
jgi:hypothetical protein